MKPSTRIIVNTLATYGRSLFAVFVSLFSARWVLMALGQADFGLYGVVGSLILVITFVNGAMSTGVARFYAYSIGHGQKNLSTEDATEELKRWFNTAVSIHSVLPVLLVLVGYPLGIHAIYNWLTIPPDRLDACLWVFKISLVTGVVNVSSIPYISMFNAHQLITELAFFDVIRSLCTFVAAYFLLKVQSDSLVVYSIFMMTINAGIPLIQMLRAMLKFKACRVKMTHLFNFKYIKNLFGFVGWKTFSMGCVISRIHGGAVLINLFFGPQANAAYSIAYRVSLQATMLSTALMGAFQPAITSVEGRGDREKMLDMALQVCKFGTLLILFIVIPLMLEMDYILKVWLKNPPQYSVPLCQWMLAMLVLDRLTSGHMLAVNAHGKIAMHDLVQGTLLFLALPLAWFFFKLGSSPVGMGVALFLTMCLFCIGRLLFCKKLLELPVGKWFRRVAIPVVILMVCSGGLVGFGLLKAFVPGFGRLCLVTIATGVCSAVLGWFGVMSHEERVFARKMVVKFAGRLILSA